MSLPDKDRPCDLDKPVEFELPGRKVRWMNKFAIVALVIIAIGIGIFLKWSFQTEQPLVVKNSPFPTRSVPPTPDKSDVLVLDIDYCKNTSKQGVVRTSYVSESREIFMPEVTEQYAEGCKSENIPILIPSNLPDGTYHIHFSIAYNINPLKQNVVVTFQSQKFEIVNGTKQNGIQSED